MRKAHQKVQMGLFLTTGNHCPAILNQKAHLAGQFAAYVILDRDDAWDAVAQKAASRPPVAAPPPPRITALDRRVAQRA